MPIADLQRLADLCEAISANARYSLVCFLEPRGLTVEAFCIGGDSRRASCRKTVSWDVLDGVLSGHFDVMKSTLDLVCCEMDAYLDAA